MPKIRYPNTYREICARLPQALAGVTLSALLVAIAGIGPLHAQTYTIEKIRGGKVALLDPVSGKKTGESITRENMGSIKVLGDAGNGKLLVERGGQKYHAKSYKLITDMPVNISSKCQSVNQTGYAATRGAGSCTQ